LNYYSIHDLKYRQMGKSRI